MISKFLEFISLKKIMNKTKAKNLIVKTFENLFYIKNYIEIIL